MYIIVMKKFANDKRPFPIAKVLTKYFEIVKDNIVFVSPGYMSVTVETIEKFCEEYIKNADTNKIVLSNGMNGSRFVNGKTIIDRHYDCFHEKYLSFSHLKDHSKFSIFIDRKSVDINKNDNFNLLELLYNKNSKVNAILIGSSNFSYNTYYATSADKGEADIFMIDEEVGNNGIVEMLEGVKIEGQGGGTIVISKEIGCLKESLKDIAIKLVESSI